MEEKNFGTKKKFPEKSHQKKREKCIFIILRKASEIKKKVFEFGRKNFPQKICFRKTG